MSAKLRALPKNLYDAAKKGQLPAWTFARECPHPRHPPYGESQGTARAVAATKPSTVWRSAAHRCIEEMPVLRFAANSGEPDT